MVPVFGTDLWYVCRWHYTVHTTHVPEIGAETHTRFLVWLYQYIACLGGTADSAAVRAAWLRQSVSLGLRPICWPNDCVRL